MDQKAAREEVRLQIADRCGGEPVRWRENVTKCGLTTVDAELFVQTQIDFRIDSFNLKTQMIADATRQAERFIAVAAELLVKEAIPAGERLFVWSDHFTKNVLRRFQLQHMTGIRDGDVSHETILSYCGLFLNREEFWMHGSAEDGQTQFRDIRPDKSDAHNTLFREIAANDGDESRRILALDLDLAKAALSGNFKGHQVCFGCNDFRSGWLMTEPRGTFHVSCTANESGNRGGISPPV